MLLLSYVLSGLGGYLLAAEFLRGVRREPWAGFAAFLGGALYAFASSKLFYAALGQGNIASSQWAPFAALYIWRAARSGGRVRDAALAGLFLVLQAYAELTYASFLLIFAGIAFVWALGTGPSARALNAWAHAGPRRKLQSSRATIGPVRRYRRRVSARHRARPRQHGPGPADGGRLLHVGRRVCRHLLGRPGGLRRRRPCCTPCSAGSSRHGRTVRRRSPTAAISRSTRASTSTWATWRWRWPSSGSGRGGGGGTPGCGGLRPRSSSC